MGSQNKSVPQSPAEHRAQENDPGHKELKQSTREDHRAHKWMTRVAIIEPPITSLCP